MSGTTIIAQIFMSLTKVKNSFHSLHYATYSNINVNTLYLTEIIRK